MYRHIHLCSNAEAVLTTIIITRLAILAELSRQSRGPHVFSFILWQQFTLAMY